MVSRNFFVLLLLAAAVSTRAQTPPLDAPTPLVEAQQTTIPAGGTLALIIAAEHAHEIGWPTLAATLYRAALAQPAGAGGDRARLTLALVTALLDAGEISDAEETLRSFLGVRGSAWYLREGLIAAHRGRNENARAALAQIRAEDLSAVDRGWWFFLQGQLAAAAGDANKANDFYEQAQQTSVSDLQKARFELAHRQLTLRTAPVTPEVLQSISARLDAQRGRVQSYATARTYAVMLNAAGRRDEAIRVLQDQLQTLPAEERDEASRTELLLGLIAGAADNSVGRNALGLLLARGRDLEMQRMALQLLANASRTPQARADFSRRMTELIEGRTRHPLLEDLLLFRAQTALASPKLEDREQADRDAKRLLAEFPGSQLKAHALGVLMNAAWEQRRYRMAADYATRARNELPPGHPSRASLGVLVAEAWYRAGDFRSSAEAYGAALEDVPAGLPAGDLMFQRVLAEISAGALAQAQERLDEYARDPRFDPLNRWQAEWNLSRALQANGATAETYARVNKLLSDGSAAPDSVELRVRMAWLQVRLSLEAGDPQRTIDLADALTPKLQEAEPGLREELASAAALLRARAQLELGPEDRAIAALKKVREDFPKSNAAVYSYLIEADHSEQKGLTVEAQKLLISVAENFSSHAYAPNALYRASGLAKLGGKESDFRAAYQLLERLVSTYPQSDFFFAARLEQGDLLSKMNQFPQAEETYKLLVNHPHFADYAGRFGVQLALADCHRAQAAADPAHADRAEEIYERLVLGRSAPIDVLVEAGHKLGLTLAHRGNLVRAQLVWARDVIDPFLLHAPAAAELGVTGRFWMARTLYELGNLYEQQLKLEEAKEAWLLMLKAKLPYAEAAKTKLARFNLPEVKL